MNRLCDSSCCRSASAGPEATAAPSALAEVTWLRTKVAGLEQQLGEIGGERRALQQQAAAMEAELRSARQAAGRPAGNGSSVSSEQLARLQAQLKVMVRHGDAVATDRAIRI